MYILAYFLLVVRVISGNQSPSLHVVTYATHTNNKGFCFMNTSLQKFEFPSITILGLDRKAHFRKHRLTDKLWALRDYISFFHSATKNDSHSTVILFLDAYDVLVNAHAHDMLERFHNNRGQHRILFAAEKGCSGTKENMMRLDNACDHENPHIRENTPTPWINTGLFIGYKTELKELLDLAWDEYATTTASLLDREPHPYLHGSDQLLIYHIYKTHRHNLQMGIDLYSDIFKCMYQVQYENVNDISFYQHRLAIKHSVYTFPVMIHFNGNYEKSLIPIFTKKLNISGC